MSAAPARPRLALRLWAQSHVSRIVGKSCVLLEHGDWEIAMAYGDFGLQKNTWLLMSAAIAVQTALVQVLGSLADRLRFQTRLSMSFVGDVEALRESAVKARLASHLRVSIADISLQAVVSELKESDAASKASTIMGQFKSREQRLLDQLKKKQGAASKVKVTEVTATIATSQPVPSKKLLVTLQNHTAGTLAAVLGDALGDSTMIQAKRVEQASEVKHDLVRRRLLAYAQFWQRMMDMVICLVIFGTLVLLSMLPILQIQTSILFNRAFASILNRKIHKQELLDDLYTPGLFYEVEAEETEKDKGGVVNKTMRGMRRGSVTVARNIGSALGAKNKKPLATPEKKGKGGTVKC